MLYNYDNKIYLIIFAVKMIRSTFTLPEHMDYIFH